MLSIIRSDFRLSRALDSIRNSTNEFLDQENLVAILYTSRDTSISGLAAAILDFRPGKK